MQLQPNEAVSLVSTQYHRDGHGHYLLLRGTAPGKGLWLEEFGSVLTAEDPELITLLHVNHKFEPMIYGGDLLNEIIARRSKVVIVMGSNLTETDERHHRAIAAYFGFKFHTVDNFLTFEEQALYPPVLEPSKYDPDLTNAIIVDLDGTYADSSHRKPFGSAYGDILKDSVIKHVATTVDLYHNNGAQIIFVTGRGESYPEIGATKDWLWDHSGVGDNYILYTRQPGDNRPDQLVKREIYEQNIRGNFNVILVLDDRPKVVRMWHELGLPVLANQAYIRGEF